KDMGQTVQLRVKPRSSPPATGELTWLYLRINGRPWPENLANPDMPAGLVKVANDTFYVINIPTVAINDEGTLLLEVRNANPPGSPSVESPEGTRPGSINYTPGEGLKVLYKVGSFEANLSRGMTMI